MVKFCVPTWSLFAGPVTNIIDKPLPQVFPIEIMKIIFLKPFFAGVQCLFQ